MEFDVKESGARLKGLRTEKRLTQEALADALNISWDHLCRIERGNRMCSFSLAMDIAGYFNVSLDFLAFGKSNDPEAFRESLLSMAEELKSIANKM